MNELAKAAALNAAKKSTAKKRKVGAAIVNGGGQLISTGFNYNPNRPDEACEDIHGNTYKDTIHAEVAAIEDCKDFPYAIYVTHPPCDNCREAIRKAGIEEVHIVNEFMKFDTNKLRYDLIPPEALEALASVLTYGAKKYKPNNWKEVDDIDRYVAAMFRHIEAYRKGERLDQETGLPHLAHAMTNVMFLLYLDNKDNQS